MKSGLATFNITLVFVMLPDAGGERESCESSHCKGRVLGWFCLLAAIPAGMHGSIHLNDV